MSIKITASEEQVFRLRDCTEDDTIFIGFWSISSELLKHIGVCFQLTVPVGAGAVFNCRLVISSVLFQFV